MPVLLYGRSRLMSRIWARVFNYAELLCLPKEGAGHFVHCRANVCGGSQCGCDEEKSEVKDVGD